MSPTSTSHLLRRETEHLTRPTDRTTPENQKTLKLLELGAGIGTVGLLASTEWPDLFFFGIEKEGPDVMISRLSTRSELTKGMRHSTKLAVRHWDLMLADLPFDWAIANPPYLTPHSYLSALIRRIGISLERVGTTVLTENSYCTIISGSRLLLTDGSLLQLEHDHSLRCQVLQSLWEHSFRHLTAVGDLSRIPRYSSGNFGR